MAEQTPELTEEGLKRKYEADFDPIAYFNSLYKKPTGDDYIYTDFMKFVVSFLHRVFTIDLPGGDSVLDLGCGPSIFAIISASSRYKNIVSADLLEKSRQEVRKWAHNDPTALDWTYVFQTVASLEKETDYRKLEARLRSRMKEVIHCDVTLPNPIAPLRRTFDVIVTSSCYEAISTSPDSFKRIVANTANLLAPNGHLVVAGVLNLTSYIIGTASYVSFEITKKLVEEAMSEAGLDVLLFIVNPKHKNCKVTWDFTDLYVLLAKKRN